MPRYVLAPVAWAGLAARARSWSEQSQLVARRNAMTASTALAARRRDREDVEQYFAALPAPARPASRGRAH